MNLMEEKSQQMFKSKICGSVQEVIFPDFPDDDNTVTTTVTKSRRVSFGTNFIKEFIVGSAVSATCVSEYEQAFSSSDSSNPNSSHSAVESDILDHDPPFISENPKIHPSGPPAFKPPDLESVEQPKPTKFSRTICFSADSPTADMEFTEGCISLAKSILDKKNKEMTVIIQAKSKEPKEEERPKKEDVTMLFDGSQLEMSETRCLKSKENKREDKRFESEKTRIFNKFDDEMSITRCDKMFKTKQFKLPDDNDFMVEESKENIMPLDLIMRQLDKDDSDTDLFNPEKSFSDVLNSQSFDLTNESEKLNLNESMDISKDFQQIVNETSQERMSFNEKTQENLLVGLSISDEFDEQIFSCQAEEEEVQATPAEEDQANPAKDVQTISAKDVQTTPAKNVQATPARDVQITPARDVQANLAKDVLITPARDVQTFPAKDVQATPARDVRTIPAKDVQANPAKDVQATPTRDVQATPTRDVQATPTRDVQANPAKDVQITPARDVQATPPKDVQTTAKNVEATPAKVVQANLVDVDLGHDMSMEIENEESSEKTSAYNLSHVEQTPVEESFQESIQNQSEPLLVDVKVIENIEEQSKESNCVWSLEDVRYPESKTLGLLSFNFTLLQTPTIVQFNLKKSREGSIDSCSMITESSVCLKEDTAPRHLEYNLVLRFGFKKQEEYFNERKRKISNIRHIPIFLDELNNFMKKINFYLEEVYEILISYPGSTLTDAILSFRLFSYPMFFSSTVFIDLTHLFRLSESSLSFKRDIGHMDEKSIRNIFQDCLKERNCLREFIIRSSKYLFDMERSKGLVSKRSHIRLLPAELRL